MSADPRLGAPPWRHDAYTLRRLEDAIRDCVGLQSAEGRIGTGRRTVDLGCGTAPYRSLFTATGNVYVGCDLEAGPAVEVAIGKDGTTELPAASADLVVSFQVLEHVWSLDDYLSECHRLLTADGRLLLSTHGTWLYHPHPTDFRRWTRDGLVREIESRGFEVLNVRAVVGPLAWTTQFRTIAWWHVLARGGYPGRLVAAALALVMYARMVLEDAVTPHTLRDTNAAVYLVTARPVR